MAKGSRHSYLCVPTLVPMVMAACFSKPGFTGRDGAPGDGRLSDGLPSDGPLRGPNLLPADAVFDRKPTVADVDSDGYDDLVVHGQSNSSGNKFHIWISYGGPAFNPAQFTQALLLDDVLGNAPQRAGEVTFALEPAPNNSTAGKVPLLLAVAGASPNGDGTFDETIGHVFISDDGGKSFAKHHSVSTSGRAAYAAAIPGVVFLQHSLAGATRLFFGTKIGRFSAPLLPSSFVPATNPEPDLVVERTANGSALIPDDQGILFGMEEPTTRTLIEFGTQGAYRQVAASQPMQSSTELSFNLDFYKYRELPELNLTGRTTLPTTLNSFFIGAVTHVDWGLNLVLLKLGVNNDVYQISVRVQTSGLQLNGIRDLAIDPHQAEANVVVLADEQNGGEQRRRLGIMPTLNRALGLAMQAPTATTPEAPQWAADFLVLNYDMVVTGRFQSKTESQSWVLATGQRDNPPQCYKFVSMQLIRC